MNTIETKNNFVFFENLSYLLSMSLIVFCTLIIFIFTTNIILSHIEKNKKNIGTLKAFGLSNIFIIILYTAISLFLIAIAFSVSLWLSNWIGNYFLIVMCHNFKLIINDGFLLYQNYSVGYLIIFFIFMPIIFILFRITWYIKGKTPGDLIYERD